MRAIIIAAFSLISTPAAAQVQLDQLSNCESLQGVYENLASKSLPACRSPRSILEASVARSFNRYSLKDVCLLQQPIASSLSRFSCFRFAQNNSGTIVGRELLCFRRIDKASVEDFTQRYDERYEEQANSYQRSSAACSLSNGDIAASESYFPHLAGGVSRPRFGFVLALGNGSKTSDRAYHGFAELDPEISSSSDVEIISIYRATAAWSVSKSSLVGTVLKHSNDLIVTEEVDKNIQHVMNAQFAPLGARVNAIHHSFSIDYLNRRGFESSVANELLDEWALEVRNYLKDNQFRLLSSREARRMGIDPSAITKRYTDQLPFLVRSEIAERTDPTEIYISSDIMPCMSRGDGFALAMIGKTHATEAFRTSDLAISVLLVGSCRGGTNASTAKKAIAVAREAILDDTGEAAR